MLQRLKEWPVMLLFLGCVLPGCQAQVTQFLPEADTYVGLSDHTQFWFQAKETREDQAPTQVEIGPSFNFFQKPLVKLNNATLFDLDKSKQRLLVMSVGYRYLPSPGNPSENRILVMGTLNFPLSGNVLLADRNRVEVNFTNGDATWRYRNRLTLQRTIAIHSYHPR